MTRSEPKKCRKINKKTRSEAKKWKSWKSVISVIKRSKKTHEVKLKSKKSLTRYNNIYLSSDIQFSLLSNFHYDNTKHMYIRHPQCIWRYNNTFNYFRYPIFINTKHISLIQNIYPWSERQRDVWRCNHTFTTSDPSAARSLLI